MRTGVVALSSDLKRKAWMREGLIQAASTSFWNTYTGNSKDAIVFQKNNPTAGAGHTVVFDFDGNLKGKAIKGKKTATGNGESKKKFSDKLTVDRYRLVADNGDSFDGVDIGDLSISQHADSRARLGDLFVRFKDQSLFDSAQGNAITQKDGLAQAPTHVIDLGTTFNFNSLREIEKILKTSNGYTTGGIRRPLNRYKTSDGRPLWLMVIDAYMKDILLQDGTAVTSFASTMQNADVRGNNNRSISGIIGKVGQLLVVEADSFFGTTDGTTTGWEFDASEVEISGLRQYSGADPTTAPWTGQSTFDPSSANLHSRGIILGAGAMQCAFGKQPDYKFQESQDFAITSESAVEFWMESQKTKLLAEDEDYAQAKVAGIDFGVVAVDLEVQ